MPHPEREHSLQIEVARLRKLHEDTEDARCVLLAELRASERALAAANARADAALARAADVQAANLGLAHRMDEVLAAHGAAESALAAANARADAATAKAEQYERDWYAAKNDFGNAMAKSREALAAARRECEGLKTYALALRQQVEDTILVAKTDDDKDGFITAYHFKTGAIHRLLARAREPVAAIAAPAAAAGRDPATEDADAAWRDGEAHGRDE